MVAAAAAMVVVVVVVVVKLSPWWAPRVHAWPQRRLQGPVYSLCDIRQNAARETARAPVGKGARFKDKGNWGTGARRRPTQPSPYLHSWPIMSHPLTHRNLSNQFKSAHSPLQHSNHLKPHRCPGARDLTVVWLSGCSPCWGGGCPRPCILSPPLANPIPPQGCRLPSALGRSRAEAPEHVAGSHGPHGGPMPHVLGRKGTQAQASWRGQGRR